MLYIKRMINQLDIPVAESIDVDIEHQLIYFTDFHSSTLALVSYDYDLVRPEAIVVNSELEVDVCSNPYSLAVDSDRG